MVAAGEKKCPRCAEHVKFDALACKHCGYEFDAGEVKAAVAKGKKATKETALGCGVLALIAIGSLAMCTGSSDPTADEQKSARAAVIAAYRETVEVVAGCDNSVASFEKRIRGASGLENYKEAKATYGACDAAWQELTAINTPAGLSAAAQAKFNEAKEACSGSYFLRRRAFETVMKIANEEGKPADTLAVEEDLKAAQAGSMLCVAKWFGAAESAGIPAAALK